MAKSLRDLLSLLPAEDQQDAAPTTRVQVEPTLDSRFSRLLTQSEQQEAPVEQMDEESNPFLNPDPKNLVRPRPALVTLETPNPQLDQDVVDMLEAQNQEQQASQMARPASIRQPAQTTNSSNFYDTLLAASNAAAGMSQAASGVKTQPNLKFLEDLRAAPNRAQELEAGRARIESERLNQEATRQALKQKELDLEDKMKMKDPNSAESAAFREQVLSMFPQYASLPGFNSASAEQLDNTFKFLNLKEQIDARMQQAQLRREEAAAVRADKKADKLFELKEKEEIQVRKEDRKLRTELDRAETALQAQLDKLKEAKDQFTKYSKKSFTGTGPLATAGGLTKYLSQKTEALDSTFSKISLDEMVKMFAGMSKAVDSNAERRAFESTQPSVALDDATNAMILDRQIKAAESLLEKTKKSKQQYDKTGQFGAAASSSADEEERRTSDGRTAIFDKNTKQFIRWKN